VSFPRTRESTFVVAIAIACVIPFGIRYLNKNICLRVSTVNNSNFNRDKINYTYEFAVSIRKYQFSFALEENKTFGEKFLKYIISLCVYITYYK
jgi:hypothetical protein